MKSYNMSRKNIKQSVNNLSAYLKEQGIKIPYNTLLHMIAKVFFMKNWQTLDASFDSPEERTVTSDKIFIIECKASESEIESVLLSCAQEAQCLLKIKDKKIYGDKKEFVLDVLLQDGYRSNFLTAMMIFSNRSKKLNFKEKWKIVSMDYWSIDVRKEDLLGLL